MAGRFWTDNCTWRTRYDDFGVTGYILLHLRGVKKAVIIDVGCSTGEAILECKKCLSKYDINLYTIGVDMTTDDKTCIKSMKNLDEFINKNICDVDEYIGKADVIICLNMTRFVSGDLKSDIIKKCAKFLKPDGVLITGVNPIPRKIKLEDPSASKPKRVCARSLRSLMHHPQDTRMMKRDNILEYARTIQTEWDKKSCWYRKIICFWYCVWRFF